MKIAANTNGKSERLRRARFNGANRVCAESGGGTRSEARPGGIGASPTNEREKGLLTTVDVSTPSCTMTSTVGETCSTTASAGVAICGKITVSGFCRLARPDRAIMPRTSCVPTSINTRPDLPSAAARGTNARASSASGAKVCASSTTTSNGSPAPSRRARLASSASAGSRSRSSSSGSPSTWMSMRSTVNLLDSGLPIRTIGLGSAARERFKVPSRTAPAWRTTTSTDAPQAREILNQSPSAAIFSDTGSVAHASGRPNFFNTSPHGHAGVRGNRRCCVIRRRSIGRRSAGESSRVGRNASRGFCLRFELPKQSLLPRSGKLGLSTRWARLFVAFLHYRLTWGRSERMWCRLSGSGKAAPCRIGRHRRPQHGGLRPRRRLTGREQHHGPQNDNSMHRTISLHLRVRHPVQRVYVEIENRSQMRFVEGKCVALPYHHGYRQMNSSQQADQGRMR